MDRERRLQQLSIANLTEEKCPSIEHLAAYTLGMLTGNEQLLIAAHVRSCPICTHEVEICRPPQPRQQPFIARLMPFTLADGHRRSTDSSSVRQYVAADIVIELTISPPKGDYWNITGQVFRDNVKFPQAAITLRAGRRRYEQTSDDQGFFTFEMLPAGKYTLLVTHDQVQVQIRNLILDHNDE
jgi:hypothetical protein